MDGPSHSSLRHQVFVVSSREATRDGETARAEALRSERNHEWEQRRKAEEDEATAVDAAKDMGAQSPRRTGRHRQHRGVDPRNLGDVNVFSSPMANISAIFVDLEGVPMTENIHRAMACVCVI